MRHRRSMLLTYGLLVLLGLGLLAGYALAEPGGKDDPLVTISFLRKTAMFQRQKVSAGRSLRLSPGAEFVLLEPSEALRSEGIDQKRNNIINLSAGQRLSETRLTPQQHYVNAGDGDVFLKFDEQAVLLLKGEWK